MVRCSLLSLFLKLAAALMFAQVALIYGLIEKEASIFFESQPRASNSVSETTKARTRSRATAIAGSVPRAVKEERCICVHCKEDANCGTLWGRTALGTKGNSTSNLPTSIRKISLVVSHCLHDLHWIKSFTTGYNIDDVTIISKCGKEVEGAPEGSTVLRLPNVGRCDHSYAYYMSHMDNSKSPLSIGDDDDLVVFLKDDMEKESIHQPGSWRSLDAVTEISSKHGFACGMEPKGFWTMKDAKRTRVLLSTFHITNVLTQFSLKKYESIKQKYANVQTEAHSFTSNFTDFAEWMGSIPFLLPAGLTEVCYGGSFAANKHQIRKQPISVWKSLEKSLSRADNIEEGHFAERSWAGMLSTPIEDYEIAALLDYSTEVVRVEDSIVGALAIPRNMKFLDERQREHKK